MRRILTGVVGFGLAVWAAPAGADGVADAKAPIAKYSKLPTFEAPGPAFDAVACMKGKKIFGIPLTTDNPFEVAILGGMAQAGKMVGFEFRAWQNQLSPDQWTQGLNKAVDEKFSLVDLVGGLPPELIAPQIAEARGKGMKVTTTHDYDFTQKAPDILDGNGHTDYVTVGKLIAAWTIAKTDGHVDAVVFGPDEITPTTPLKAAVLGYFKANCPDCKTTYINTPAAEWATKVQPGLHDMIAAVIANKIGFDFVYASGFWLTASGFGLPDAGIASYTQMLDRVATLTGIVDAGVIADADTGYGGLLNVDHTVRGYERAGVVAIQIEDQEFPKKCGHTPFKRVAPVTDMVEKIKVACAARKEMLVIARTDARQPEGFESAVKRGLAYAEAGADIVFLEALESEAEMREECRRIAKPMMANMADGGKTPIRSKTELAEIGYALAIYPSITGLAAGAAVENALNVLKNEGASNSANLELFNFREFQSLIGFEEIWAFERKWARNS